MPIGFAKYRFQRRVAVLHFRFAVHAADVVGDKVHGTGAIEGHHGNDVIQRLGLHLHQPLGHPRTFQLEDAHGIAFPEELVGFRVVGGDIVERVMNVVALFDRGAGTRHDGQSCQAQEVHLEHFELFEDTHFELCNGLDGSVFGVVGGTMQRQVLGERLIGNDHAGGMSAGIADDPFHFGGGVDQLPDMVGGLVGVLQLRVPLEIFGDHVTQRDGPGGDVRDDLGHPVHFGEGDVHDTAHIAQGGARSQRTEGDDLGYFILPVFIDGVIEHISPAVVGEVEVDIGHGNATGVQETFEEQFLLKGVHHGNIQ